jgi:DNA polymerase-3 subunit delta
MNLKGRADIEGFLAAPGPLFQAAVIHGDDAGLVRERAQELASHITERPDDPFDVGVVGGSELEGDPARLGDELAAISMMGGRRLVRVKLDADRGPAVAITAQAMQAHLAGEFNPDAFLVVEAPALPKDSPLRASGEKAPACAVIACWDDEPGDVKIMVRKALAAEGLGLTGEALEAFVARLPHDRGVTRSEIERLILYLGPGAGRTAGLADLEDFAGVEPEASLAAAAADAFGGRLAAAQAGLRRTAASGDAGPAAVRALGMHLARLRRILTLREGGAELQAAARAARIFWKDEREFVRQARAWSVGMLDSSQVEVFAADQATKQTGAPGALIAERLALTIAARARRAGL